MKIYYIDNIYIYTHIFGSGTQLLRCSGQAHDFAKTALLLCVVGPDELALSQLRDEETITWCGVWTSAHEVSGQRRRPKDAERKQGIIDHQTLWNVLSRVWYHWMLTFIPWLKQPDTELRGQHGAPESETLDAPWTLNVPKCHGFVAKRR
jgi:hypothetical protein